MAALNADDPRAALEMGNAVWVADWFRPRAQYPDIARETCLAAVEGVDFATGDEDGKKEGAERINGWAEAATRGKIPEVLNEDDVGGGTAMVLTRSTSRAPGSPSSGRRTPERRCSAWAAQTAPAPTS